MAKEEKNYRTSCPADRTELSKFTGQFQISSDTPPIPFPPMIFFLFIEFLSDLCYHGY